MRGRQPDNSRAIRELLQREQIVCELLSPRHLGGKRQFLPNSGGQFGVWVRRRRWVWPLECLTRHKSR